MMKSYGKPVLVLIDVQKGFKDFFPGKWSSDTYAEKISEILAQFRNRGWRVIHVRHDSLKPDSPLSEGKPGFEFQEEARPVDGEIVITKHVNSAFIGTDLEEILRKEKPDAVVYCGLVTDHCVSTTARMSGNLGFKTIVVEDACATYPKRGLDGKEIDAITLHNANLASINGEFAEVVRTSDLF